MTRGGKYPLPSTRENCPDIEVTDDDIKNSVRAIPKVKTLVRIMSNFTILFFNNNTNNNDSNNIVSNIIEPSALVIGEIANQVK